MYSGEDQFLEVAGEAGLNFITFENSKMTTDRSFITVNDLTATFNQDQNIFSGEVCRAVFWNEVDPDTGLTLPIDTPTLGVPLIKYGDYELGIDITLDGTLRFDIDCGVITTAFDPSLTYPTFSKTNLSEDYTEIETFESGKLFEVSKSNIDNEAVNMCYNSQSPVIDDYYGVYISLVFGVVGANVVKQDSFFTANDYMNFLRANFG